MAILKTNQNKKIELQLNKVQYSWAYELLEQGVANTWFPREIPLSDDLRDWTKMSPEEREAVTMYLGFSNPMEFEVNESITKGMMPFISAPEAQMYMVRQMWEEVNHSMTFDYIINTLQIDREKTFNTHKNISEVASKEKFLTDSIDKMASGSFDIYTDKGIKDFIINVVKTNIVTEGIWFFSSFMFALSFRQRNLMKNLGSLVDWIMRDESLHLKFGMNLVLTVLEEFPDVVTSDFANNIRNIILESVELEIKYNNALIPNGILGMNVEYINKYVKYIADRRLEELGFQPEFKVQNPAKWMATNDTLQLVNFFEQQNTSYEVNAGGGKPGNSKISVV